MTPDEAKAVQMAMIDSSKLVYSLVPWQPVETAPRNGDEILVTDARTDRFYQVVSWHPSTDQMREGWEDVEGNLIYHPEAFTHWMPLPEPPQNSR